tara:strand:+ start:283 stop:720 length:438 start_codon:yes stop_codon:yes gene_type:complete
MKRIKSAPANIAEMINRKKENPIIKTLYDKSQKIIYFNQDNKKIDNSIFISDKYKNIRLINTNIKKITSILNDILIDILNLSFEETAFLGIILNLTNNIFRKDKLKDFSDIVLQTSTKYFIMFYLHHYILNDYIEKHHNFIDYLH